MKILILVLHSKLGIYNDLMKIQEYYLNKICQKNKNILWYKYYFKEDIKDHFIDEKENSIIIKGKESYNPGCRIKTYEAFKLMKNKDYDYLVRINESTIVDYTLLEKILIRYKPQYAGAINTIQSKQIDEEAGLYDFRYAGGQYMSGRCIIIKKSMVKNILDHLIKYEVHNIIDDLSIGIIISKYEKKWLILNRLVQEGNKFILKKGLIYSHKSENRNDDLKFMKNTIKYLLNIKN